MCLDWLWCLVTMNIISYCLRFDQHADAAQAITAKHGTQLEGYTVKCSWGKEGAGLPSTMGASGYNGVSCEWCHYLTPYFLRYNVCYPTLGITWLHSVMKGWLRQEILSVCWRNVVYSDQLVLILFNHLYQKTLR